MTALNWIQGGLKPALRGRPPQPAGKLLLHHGVRSAPEYADSGDLQKALAASNPDMAPHLAFVDMGGHGYATVRVSRAAAPRVHHHAAEYPRAAMTESRMSVAFRGSRTWR